MTTETRTQEQSKSTAARSITIIPVAVVLAVRRSVVLAVRRSVKGHGGNQMNTGTRK